MSKKHAHLTLIQGAINRLSQNSFLLKGWSVVLISGMLALSTSAGNPKLVYLAILPAVVFWGLDGYFLAQERRFRGLYDYVRAKAESEVDFSMNTQEVQLSRVKWYEATFSMTLIVFHGVLAAVLVLLAFINVL